MPIARTPWIDDDGSGTVGTVINNAEKTALYNQIDAVAEPPWVDVPYSASNFGATGGTWTVPAGNVGRFSYRLSGKWAHVMISIDGASVGGTPSSLNIVLPWNLVGSQSGPFYYYADPAFGWGIYQQPSVDQYMRLFRDIFASPWAAVPTIAIRLSITLQLA